jgi:hypothetical protein
MKAKSLMVYLFSVSLFAMNSEHGAEKKFGALSVVSGPNTYTSCSVSNGNYSVVSIGLCGQGNLAEDQTLQSQTENLDGLMKKLEAAQDPEQRDRIYEQIISVMDGLVP